MPNAARCKFTVIGVTHRAHGFKEVEMHTQYDEPLSKEDEAFSKATPSGDLSFHLDNPALADFFEPGKAYYIDITPAED